MSEYVNCSNIVWTRYIQHIQKMYEWKRPESFEKSLYAWGHLQKYQDLRNAILAAKSSPLVKIVPFEAAPSAWKDKDIAMLNECNIFKVMDGLTRWELMKVLRDIEPTVTSLLGCPWAVHNVRSYISKDVAHGGPYEWHIDGEPPQMLKIMIYFQPIGGKLGGLEVDRGGGETNILEGPAGTWVIFYNSLLKHRAIPAPGRIATEITISPWNEMNLEPRTLGINSRYPFFPLPYD